MTGEEGRMKLECKVSIVTGAGQGIGQAIALSLAKEGADVVVNDMNIETAKSIAAEIQAMGRRTLAIKADVGKSEEVNEMVTMIISEMGGVDILVNNAGGGARERGSEFKDSTEEVWDFVINRNLKGVLNCTRAVINHMIERQSGKIVNIASTIAFSPEPGQADYGGAKAGIIGFSKSLAKEVGRYGINVNCVSPGVIETIALKQVPQEMLERYLSKQILKRRGQPQDIANMVVFLASEEASFITGQNYAVCGGISV